MQQDNTRKDFSGAGVRYSDSASVATLSSSSASQIEQKEAIGLEELCQFLSYCGISPEKVDADKNGFSRTISFTVYGINYRIIWFKNQSTLRIGSGDRAACIPFKWVYLDRTYPLVGGNMSIGFSYVKNVKKSIFDRYYPYEVFRIPLELQEDAVSDTTKMSSEQKPETKEEEENQQREREELEDLKADTQRKWDYIHEQQARIAELEEALREGVETIKWMWNNMTVDDKSLQSDSFNIPANTIEKIDQLLNSK